MFNQRIILLLIVVAFIVSDNATSQVYLTKEETLKLYFPQSSIERKTLFLTDEQLQKIQSIAKAKLDSKILTYYVANGAKGIDGYAFFETHIVRTMPETFIAVLDQNGIIRAVEILAFYEPEDYLPSKRWLALFGQKNLNDNLWVKRGIPNISGATLSTHAITEGVRRILATFSIAIPKETQP